MSRRNGHRDEWAEECKAARDAARTVQQIACNAKPPLSNRELRVLMAVISGTGLWSKFEDQAAHGPIAKQSGVPLKHIGSTLKSLDTRGLIIYRPGDTPKGGARRPSIVRLPAWADPRNQADPPLMLGEGQLDAPPPDSGGESDVATPPQSEPDPPLISTQTPPQSGSRPPPDSGGASPFLPRKSTPSFPVLTQEDDLDPWRPPEEEEEKLRSEGKEPDHGVFAAYETEEQPRNVSTTNGHVAQEQQEERQDSERTSTSDGVLVPNSRAAGKTRGELMAWGTGANLTKVSELVDAAAHAMHVDPDQVKDQGRLTEVAGLLLESDHTAETVARRVKAKWKKPPRSPGALITTLEELLGDGPPREDDPQWYRNGNGVLVTRCRECGHEWGGNLHKCRGPCDLCDRRGFREPCPGCGRVNGLVL